MNIFSKLIGRVLYFNSPIKYARFKGVIIGKGNSFVDHPSFGSEPYLIIIGDNNRLSFNITFLTHDGGRWVLDHYYTEESPFIKFGKITIGNNCFIGCKSIIMPGVNIANNCIIAAGSIVTKSIPTGEIWGGAPAKYIMTIEEYKNKLKNNKSNINLSELHKNKEKELKRIFT